MSELDRILECVPLARPGFESFGITAPVMMQINPEGTWQSSEPKCLEESRLKAVVAHLTKSHALSVNQTYCSQCAVENKVNPNHCNYVPVIMIPIHSPCPFDMDSETANMNESDAHSKKKNAVDTQQADNGKEKSTKKKKRGFVIQRLNNNDLLSQW